MVVEAPLRLHSGTVRPEWIDYNGHMNLAYYVLAFDHGTDAFLDYLGLGERYLADSGRTTFVLETHVTYERELKLGDAFDLELLLLGFDPKRIHYFQWMREPESGACAASTEIMKLHVDRAAARAAPFPDPVLGRLAAVHDVHAALPRPAQAGRVMGLQSRRPT